jgi:hypothetical protein
MNIDHGSNASTRFKQSEKKQKNIIPTIKSKVGINFPRRTLVSSRHVECIKKLRGQTTNPAASELPLESSRRPNRPLNKMAALPPINLIKARLPHQLILAQRRQHNRPDQPVNPAAGDDCNTNDAVQVVRQGFVHGDAVLGRHERRDDQVDVADEEEDCDGERGAEGRVPVVLLAVRVEPDEAEGDEGVYYGEGIGDYAGKGC